MKRIFKKILLISCITCVVFIIIWATLFHGIVGRHWPKIENPSLLVVECESLMSAAGLGDLRELNEKKWSTEIRKLHPRAVGVCNTFVDITISGGGIGSAWGYIILKENLKIESLRQSYKL